jgi:hypothetical protein
MPHCSSSAPYSHHTSPRAAFKFKNGRRRKRETGSELKQEREISPRLQKFQMLACYIIFGASSENLSPSSPSFRRHSIPLAATTFLVSPFGSSHVSS